MTVKAKTVGFDVPGRPRRKGKLVLLGPFALPGLDRTRQVAVYLPPGYEADPSRRFPVMYMFDGQNLFDPTTSFCGDWEMDLAIDALASRGEIEPLIAVGIYNGGEHRISEQSPWLDPQFSCRGEANAFLDWICGGLKAQIDKQFRTRTAPEDTGIGGSSMGGLTALYSLLERPGTFGKALCMSPSFWFARGAIFDYVAALGGKPKGSRIYLDFGAREARPGPGTRLLRDARIMRELLCSQGFVPGEDLLWVEDPSGIHNEACWNARLPGALRFLWKRTAARAIAG
ncbi:MAG: alpha/beta hydrolase [Cyanobacteria bacterium REEB65]|nr:alpha/beta hydrolase [Cyanobacteria bacterium REEB65]